MHIPGVDQVADEAPVVREIKSEIIIDHREWRNWGMTEHHGAVKKLNELLEPHGVVIVHKSNPIGRDFFELEAVSFDFPEE
jgi:hypothetical protein